MKTPAFAFYCSSVALSLVGALQAQRPLPAVEADRAWLLLQAPAPVFATATTAGAKSFDAAELKAVENRRAVTFLAEADRAKDFYTRYAEHEKSPEAKLAEVRALVNVVQAGDATVEGRLVAAVQAMCADLSLSKPIRVQAVSAYEFSRQTRGLRTHEERLTAIEQVARKLAVDFPDQPQGYESLLTVASTHQDEIHSKKIARDLLTMPAPVAVKERAQKLLGRFDLVGKPISTELIGANETTAKASLRPGRPTIVYSWATGSPGSLALAADLKKRSLAANVVGINLDTDPAAAAVVAQKEGLIGSIVYDRRGREGALAQRLKIMNASQVFLIDAQGVIREVRGESDLPNKLKRIGL